MTSPMRYPSSFTYKCPICKDYVTWSDVVFKDRDHYCLKIHHPNKLRLVKGGVRVTQNIVKKSPTHIAFDI